MAWFLCKKGGSPGHVPVNPSNPSVYDLYVQIGDQNIVDETINSAYTQNEVIGTVLYNGSLYDNYHISGYLNNNDDSQGLVSLQYKYKNGSTESEPYNLDNHNYQGMPIDKFEFDVNISIPAEMKQVYTDIEIYFVALSQSVTLTADRHTIVEYY